MAKYQISGDCIRREDGACIPVDRMNADYQKYLEWAAEGNTPDPDLNDNIEVGRVTLMTQLNLDCNRYILSRYDYGAQQSMQALYALPSTSAENKIKIESVWDWTRAVLSDYYTLKATLAGELDRDLLNQITWDFSTHDATDPTIKLEELLV